MNKYILPKTLDVIIIHAHTSFTSVRKTGPWYSQVRLRRFSNKAPVLADEYEWGQIIVEQIAGNLYRI